MGAVVRARVRRDRQGVVHAARAMAENPSLAEVWGRIHRFGDGEIPSKTISMKFFRM